MDDKEDPMGKVKTIYCIAIDYDYIKFTFSGCGVEWLYIMNSIAMMITQEDVSSECEQISGQ